MDSPPPERGEASAAPDPGGGAVAVERELAQPDEAAAGPKPKRRARWSMFDRHPGALLVALLAIGLIAGIPRFANLSYPHDRPNPFVFDETYYAKDACLYAGHPFAKCRLTTDSEQSWVHPPLGKWMIAIGIKLFGFTPFGWRFSSALFGTATVILLALLAYFLFQSVLWAFVAGLLIAVESLEFVQSRVALLDIFVAFWVVLGFLFLVLDRRYIDSRTPPREPEPEYGRLPGPEAPAPAVPPTRRVPSPLWRPWRLAAGFALGAGFATKWNGFPPLIGAILLTAAWEVARRVRPATWLRRQPALPPGDAADVSGGADGPTPRRPGGEDGPMPPRTDARISPPPRRPLLERRGFQLVAAPAAGIVNWVAWWFAGHAFGEGASGRGSVGLALAALVAATVTLSVRTWLLVRFERNTRGLVVGTLLFVTLAFGSGLLWGSGHQVWGAVVALVSGALALLVGCKPQTAGTTGPRQPAPRWLAASWEALRQEGLTVFVGLVILPLLVYIGSFSGRITSTQQTPHTGCPYHTDVYTPGLGWHFTLAQLWHLQGEIACFHEHLSAFNVTTNSKGQRITTPAHPYLSRPWEWIYLGRPVAYYFHSPGTEILGIGNPAIFWFAILAIPWVGIAMIRRTDWVAALIFVAIVSQYLPWFIPPALDKVQFLFYATPITPFFVLADAYVLRDLGRIRLAGSRSRPFLPVAVGIVITSVAVFAWLWPVLTGYHLSGPAWHMRMWFPRWI